MIDTRTFALAGNATFTVTSRKTGTRFTYKVRKPSPTTPHFVKLLSGPDNESDYRFFGTIFTNTDAKTGRTSFDFRHAHPTSTMISPEAPAAKAFSWLWRNLDNPDNLAQVEIHHEGRCCRCGRKLTVPESIESGIGPECRNMLGF
jgi:hypothetical protein